MPSVPTPGPRRPRPDRPAVDRALAGLAGLPRADCLERVKRVRAEEWERIHASTLELLNETTGADVAAELTAVVDRIVLALWRRCRETTGTAGRAPALFALGGYGRAELAPASDLDLLLLVGGAAPTPRERAVGEAFTTLLWDCGFKVGAALRTTAELEAIVRRDFVTATALTEGRPLAAAPAQEATLTEVLRPLRRRRRRAFLRHKLGELGERRRRAGDSPFVLEPDCKNSPGCLRDVQFLGSVAYALSGHLGLLALLEVGGLRGGDLQAIRLAGQHLLLLRTLQHFHHGNRADVLRLADQERLAGQLGYVDSLPLRGVEYMMKDLFGQLALVQRTVRSLRARLGALGLIGRRPLLPASCRRLVPGFVLVGNEVHAAGAEAWHPDDLAGRLFRACRRAQRKGGRLSIDLQHRTRDHLHLLPAEHRCDPALAATFREILGDTGRVHPLVADMHAAGLLDAYLPEFRRITCLMQFDAHHHYTVDEHTLLALRRLDAIHRDGDAGDPELSDLLHRAPHRDLLALAVLLHDLGKYLGEGHVERGALMVPQIAERLHLADDERDLVHFLVAEHLLLSRATRRRDIHDPALLERLAERIDIPERLDLLYLMTWADAASVGPGRFVDWERELLRDLHRSLRAAMQGRAPGDRDAARDRVVARLVAADVAPAAIESHLAALPGDYCLRADPDAAVPAYRCLSAAREDPDRHGWCHHERAASTLLAIASPNRPGLLADVAAVLAAHGLDVIDGRTWESADDLGLDVLRVHPLFPQRWAEERTRERLAADLRRCARGEIDAETCIRRRERGVYRGRRPDSGREAIDVRIDADTSPTATIVDVHARAFTGMLSVLARAIATRGLDIAYASINTLEDRAVDTFYVSRAGDQVSDAELTALARDLRSAIERRGEA